MCHTRYFQGIRQRNRTNLLTARELGSVIIQSLSDPFLFIVLLSCCPLVTLYSCYFVLLSSCLSVLIFSRYLVLLSLFLPILLSFYHLLILSYYHLVFLSSCQIVLLPFCPNVILSSFFFCHVALLILLNLSSCPLVILLFCPFACFSLYHPPGRTSICSSLGQLLVSALPSSTSSTRPSRNKTQQSCQCN